MSKQLKADLMLLMATMFWGTSYLLTKVGLGNLEAFNLTALRFDIGFIIAAVVMYKKLLNINLKTLWYALILGTILSFVFVAMTYGVANTTASNAGFMVSLTMLFIPMISWLIFKRRPPTKVLVSLGIALIGIALLTLNSSLSMGIGDILCILCAIFNAIHIIVTDKLTKDVDSITLGILQLGVVGIINTIISFAIETPHMPSTSEAWISILGLSITCTAIGIIVQTYAQQFTTPTHAGLIFSLESVFSAIFSFIFLAEILSSRGYIGAVLMVLSLFIMELDSGWISKKFLLKKA
jgi:drug/metabolite transporter (DMT)-like permease